MAVRHFSHWPRRILFEGNGASSRVGRVHQGLRYDGGRTGQLKEKKKEGESRWKSGGGRTRLYLPERRAGRLGDSGAMPVQAGGEGSHGRAKPHGAIHRNMFNRMYLCSCEEVAGNGRLPGGEGVVGSGPLPTSPYQGSKRMTQATLLPQQWFAFIIVCTTSHRFPSTMPMRPKTCYLLGSADFERILRCHLLQQ